MVDQVSKSDDCAQIRRIWHSDQLVEAAHRPLRLLTFTTLFPHNGRPNHGIFVENRLRHLVTSGEATSTVIAPVPWFPSRSPFFGEWAKNAGAGRQEDRGQIKVYHPRFPLPPRIGMLSAPGSLFIAGARELSRLMKTGLEIDVIDGHYIYPDGVAAVALGRLFKKPVVLTARGSDVTQYPSFRLPARMIRWAMRNASALISVSSGLKSGMIDLGAAEQKITVLRNGVDLQQFRPTDPEAAQKDWGVNQKILISVGHLIERKRHDLTIEALKFLPGWTLVLVGDGSEKLRLQALVSKLGLAERVIFSGQKPHADLSSLYAGADISVLSSSREGWANVLLESMACGTPVVASNIPGNPEVVTSLAAGLIVRENTPACFAQTIQQLYQIKLSRLQTREYAEAFDWDATTQGQLRVFRNVIAAAAARDSLVNSSFSASR